MGCCISSNIATLHGITFSYPTEPFEHVDKEEKTIRYYNIDVEKPVSFSKFTIDYEYPLLLHFVDKNCIMLCKSGVGVIIKERAIGIHESEEERKMEDKNKKNSVSAYVNWPLLDEYDWVLPRLELFRKIPIVQAVIISASKFQSLKPLQDQLAQFKQRALIANEEYEKHSSCESL
jgi:hypothetical protein